LHIGSKYFHRRQFKHFLDHLPEDYGLILNGDIIECPISKLKANDRQILDRIKEISFRQTVVWVRGNHDIGFIPQSFGSVLQKSMHTIENRLLITHGHNFDEVMPHNKAFMKAFHLLHSLRVRLGAKPVHVAEYAKKWQSFYRILRKNVMLNAVNYAHEKGFQAVTCGHTHHAEDKTVNGIRYINTGAWTELPAHYLVISADNMRLVKIDGLIK
jgi:UDP-2,3-diacylglucosamine pyrophosphatase LpxH